MATSPAASEGSHDSGDEGGNDSKANLSKDKECQYCHQKFTSSSLGRHLDQFISKKKPDGIHDVEGIKRLRAGITRRTARGKKGATDSVADSHEARSARHSPAAPSVQTATPTHRVETLPKPQAPPLVTEPGDFRLNRAAWQSTGVIPDAPRHSPAHLSGSPVHASFGGARNKRSFSQYAADLPLPPPNTTTVNETTRALELSLREVLDAVNAATRRAAPLPQPFPFDLTAQTFPGLCLRLLEPPPTLFQSAPFSTPETISLSPPGVESLHALRTTIRNILDQWKWDALAHMQKHGLPSGASFADEAARITSVTQRHLDDGLRHLDAAFQFFVSNAPEQQWQLWSLELLRAYKSERDKVKETKEQMARSIQETSQLQQQIDHLSKCQWPREMALWPPERAPFSSALQQELTGTKTTSLDVVRSYGSPVGPDHNVVADKWDFDKLVNKWKRHVREDRARRGVSSAMLPPLTGDHQSLNSPVGSSTDPRKSISDPPLNGLRNGYIPHLGISDRSLGTFASQAQNNADTPSNHSNQSTSRQQTPMQNQVTIVSDLDTTFARMDRYYRGETQDRKDSQGMVGN